MKVRDIYNQNQYADYVIIGKDVNGVFSLVYRGKLSSDMELLQYDVDISYETMMNITIYIK